MFNSRQAKIRNCVLNETIIENMLHLGAHTFDELSGEVVQNSAFVIRKLKPKSNTKGTYFRLVDFKNCTEKEASFLTSSFNEKICFKNVIQKNLLTIPENPICYWASKQLVSLFENSPLCDYGWGSKGIINMGNSL